MRTKAMTPAEIDHAIAVLTAAKAGLAIQTRIIGEGEYFDCTPTWNFTQFEYRVKPEPRVIWFAERHGQLTNDWCYSPDSMLRDGTTRAVKFVEVIE